MSIQYLSTDGEWRVSVILLDGREVLRIESRSIENASTVPGIVTSEDGWHWVADVRTPAAVEEWVPLSELVEVR
jgi:hypothetical protein